MWKLVALVCVLSGCDKLLDLREVTVPPSADAGTDAFAPVVGCSPMSMVAADFEDGITSKWLPLVVGSQPMISGFYNGPQLVLVMGEQGYLTVSSEWFYDLRDDQFTIELGDSLDTTAGNEYEIELESTRAGHALAFVRRGADLMFVHTTDAIRSELDRIPYDPVEHRFLRIAHLGGVTTWQTGATRTGEFEVRATATTLDWVDWMRVHLFATRGSDTEFGISIESVGGVTSIGSACPIAQLADDFDGATLGSTWARSVAYGGTLEQANGSITMRMGTTAYNNISLSPATLYDLRGGSLTVEVPQMLDVSSTQEFVIQVNGIDRVSVVTLEQVTNKLVARMTDDALVASADYSPTDHRWLRIREGGGTVFFEVSADGTTFNPFGQASGVTGFEHASIGAFALGAPIATASAVQIDNVNIAP